MSESKMSKKCLQKQRKAQHRLLRDLKIESSTEVTKHIAICNAGLVTGLQREVLADLVQQFTNEFSIILPEGKSYSFVDFDSTENSAKFYNCYNGKVLELEAAKKNTFLYILYVKSIPIKESGKNCHIPNGLRLIENFITQDEERFLLESINWDDKELELKHRKVKHFGYEFLYENNKVDINKPSNPIPKSYSFLQNLFEKHGCGKYIYDQITVNRYVPGHGIPPHIDTHSAFEDTILSLSLGSSCVMDFKCKNEKFSLELPARSLLVLSKDARYIWQHGICPRHNDNVITEKGLTTRPRDIRISFTFRKVRFDVSCNCLHFEYCDKNENLKNSTITDNVANKLENSFVHQVYDEIAGHFNETRYKPWHNVTKFIDSIQPGSILIDIGCGNGKYLYGHPGLFKIGCDRSLGLAGICREKGFQMILADCLCLPHPDNCIDAVLCIAVIHHLATPERRKLAISEIIRVLQINGRALIYVWAKEQNKDSVKSAYLKLGAKKLNEEKINESQVELIDGNIALPVHENRTEFKHSDMLVPWKHKNTGQSFMRYYHVFERGELEKICQKVPFAEIINSYYDEGNWCIELKKQKFLNA